MSDVEIIEAAVADALPALLARAGAGEAGRTKRVFLITGPTRRYVDRLGALPAGVEVHVFAGAKRHVPDGVLAEARQQIAALNLGAGDAIVALGGGSAIGLGKALRLERAARFIAIPTTYAGSERTSMYGTTAAGKKTTGRDPRVRPDAVIYDVALTLDMPKPLTVASLMNAFAHPLGALETAAPPPEARAAALDAIDTIYGAIEALVQAPGDPRARAAAFRGAGAAALAFEAGTSDLHHKLAHKLGGRFDLDHAGLHSVLLPHTVHRLRREAPALVAEIEARLRVPDLEGSLFDFLVRAGAATSLRPLGVSWEAFTDLCAGGLDGFPRDFVSAAFHGRRPSAHTRREDWGLPEAVTVRGPPLAAARRVIVALHGRGVSADSIVVRAVEFTGNDPELAIVAPQAPNNAWYSARYFVPRAEIGAELDAALAQAGAVLDRVVAEVGAERVVLFGFSQGACLALDVFARRGQRLAAVVALSGAPIGTPEEQAERAPAPGVAGTPVLLGASREDPHIVAAHVEAVARALAGAGCDVDLVMVPGNVHAMHIRQRLFARPLLSGRAAREAPSGFGNFHEVESLAGALPRDRNSPRHAPLGLHAEQINGTAFVVPRAANKRSWLYRIRPSAQQGRLAPKAHATLASDFTAASVEPNLAAWSPLPLPAGAGAAVDFVDGLATVGGAGSPALRRGFAVHVYAANRNMDERCFHDGDGDLLILPEHGALTLLTEMGTLDVGPGHVAVVPRGVRFSVLLAGAEARGYVAEVFGAGFALPERGPVGANGLTDARHFHAPVAWHEDRLSLGYRVTVKLGGALHEATQDYSPYDVVAWHGNLCPYVYDLSRFSPVGATRIDHPDPSIYTVLSAPLDEAGVHALDLVIFPPRWDATEGTFRPPFFHRNAASELNGIVRELATSGSPFVPGVLFLTPATAPHGVRASAVEHALSRSDEAADRPVRMSDHALWFQFESALPFALTPWAATAPHRIADWPVTWGAYRKHFTE